MNTYTRWMNIMVWLMMSLLVCLPAGRAVAADASPLYDQVLEAFEALPRDAGITVDFGVEEHRYSENFKLTDGGLSLLREEQVPAPIVEQLAAMPRDNRSKDAFMQAVQQTIGPDNAQQYEDAILNSAYDGKARFAIGERFEARFRSDTACYAALVHIGLTDQGDILILLPNQDFPSVRLNAGEVYSTAQNFSIPLTAGKPRGFEVMNLLCSEQPLDLFPETGRFVQGYAIITPDDDAGLQYLLNGLQHAASGRFGGSSLVLEIGGGTRALPKKFGRLKPMGGTGTTGKFFLPVGQP